MLTDEITFYAKAGDGGDGVERWRREKFVPKGGPAGGNGGKGGDLYARALRDISILGQYKQKESFMAPNGENGREKNQKGKNGEDLYIDLPVGSVIENQNTGDKHQLLNEGEVVKLLEGGIGGYGNTYFKSSTNIRPTQTTKGEMGEEAHFSIKLMLFVDAGFVGFPNAGKSTLLNELTGARAKVADYEFTTIDPNLGDFYGFILADIPGLIEGASGGRGLGHKFLKHIERTKLLIHCISLELEDIEGAYKTIRSELGNFNAELLKKPEILVLTKKDVVEDFLKTDQIIENLKKISGAQVYRISVLDENSIKDFSANFSKTLEYLNRAGE